MGATASAIEEAAQTVQECSRDGLGNKPKKKMRLPHRAERPSASPRTRRFLEQEQRAGKNERVEAKHAVFAGIYHVFDKKRSLLLTRGDVHRESFFPFFKNCS
jgi:hypothetical protein